MADYPYPVPPCPETPEEPDIQPCADWSVCLPFGGRLYTKDGCVIAEGGNPPADGVYGKIIIANGCIAGVEPLESCLDNIAPCVGNPAGCGETAEQALQPSDAPGNLYATDVIGRPLVRCTIRGGKDITVTGDGTTANPYIISAAAIDVASVYLTSENDAIEVRGSGTYANPFALAHKKGMQTTVGGMTFDAYGHLIDTGEGSANKGITGIVGGQGIAAETSDIGMATVSLQKPARPKSGSYLMGGWKLELDDYNRVFDVTREIEIPAATYPFGAYDVSLTSTGSIHEIAPGDNGIGTAYIFNWPAGATPILRSATFSLRFGTALGGVLYTAGSLAFWQSLAITLDNLAATFQRPTAEPLPSALPFWNFGVFSAGAHTLSLRAPAGWAAGQGAVVHLFALSAPDALVEE